MKKWIALLLAALLLTAMVPATLSEGLEIEEEPVVVEDEDILLSVDVDNAAEEKDFMLFSDEPIEKGYADFLTEANPTDVPIDAAHFPDENFRNAVELEIDTDGNGVLSEVEQESVIEIAYEGYNISSVAGIEYFPNLEILNCQDNQLTSLDVSKNAVLKTLFCGSNQLTSLDMSNNASLQMLFCNDNQLTSLDVSENAELTELHCDCNPLNALDVSKNPELETLFCNECELSSLILGNFGRLKIIECYYNDLPTLDLGGCSSRLKQALLSNPRFSGESDHDLEHVLCLYDEEEYDYALWFDEAMWLTVDGVTVHVGAPLTVETSSCEITVKDKTYTGKALKPAVTVTYNGEKLKKGTDYTVTYENNTKVGTATATVKGIGNYTGSKKATFKIKPKGTTLSKVTPGKKKLTVTWKKQTKQVSGYQIQYGTKKDFSNAKKVTVSGANTAKTTIKKLKAKKTYYMRIRTYKTVSGKKYYSSWSKAKKTKTK